MNVTYDARIGGRVSGAIKEELSYFVDCVRKNEAPTAVTPRDAFEALRVALALIESAQEQRDVSLD